MAECMPGERGFQRRPLEEGERATELLREAGEHLLCASDEAVARARATFLRRIRGLSCPPGLVAPPPQGEMVTISAVGTTW